MDYETELIKSFKSLFTVGSSSISNKCTTYLLPMLGLSAEQFRGDRFPLHQFRSLFIGDKSHDTFDENKLILLYRFSGKSDFINYETFLEGLPTYIDKYEPDKFHTMYVYDIPFKHSDNFQKFLDWKPSQFTEEYKQHIMQFYKLNKASSVYQVLYKAEERLKELEQQLKVTIKPDQEYSSVPYWSIEYYQEEFKRKKNFDGLKEKNGN